jgi:uncharacterized protein YbjQ (UPF0145 family)
MENSIDFIINISVFLILLGLGYFVGSFRERRHFKDIERREAALSYMVKSDLQTIPENWIIEDRTLVVGCTVVALDYFKIVVSSLRNLFGGRILSLESLVERARREAVLRMLEEAQKISANAVWNIRLETVTVGGSQSVKKQATSGVEIIAYGTALRVKT